MEPKVHIYKTKVEWDSAAIVLPSFFDFLKCSVIGCFISIFSIVNDILL